MENMTKLKKYIEFFFKIKIIMENYTDKIAGT